MNKQKLNLDRLRVESFTTSNPAELGDDQIDNMPPGETDRSCTLCTLYQMPCC